MIFCAASRSPSVASTRRKGPIGKVSCCAILPLLSSTNSRLPPPRSPINPSASGTAAADALLPSRGDRAPRRAGAPLALFADFLPVLAIAHGRGGQHLDIGHV